MVLGWIIKLKVTHRRSKKERGKVRITECRIVVATDGAWQITRRENRRKKDSRGS